MVTLLPPDQMGTLLSQATFGAVLDVAGLLCFVVMVWAIFAFSMTSAPTEQEPILAPLQMTQTLAPLQTAMTPLEVDLAQVETLTELSVVSFAAPAALPAASPSAVVDELRADLAVNDVAAMEAAAATEAAGHEWPPAPRRPGARRYRYVNAGGRLVKLGDLVEAAVWPPSRAMLN